MKSAVLFIVFNRPHTTARVFEGLRAARPPRLYVAADGPRADRAGEEQRCAEARAAALRVDWPCEVKTLFQTDNCGPLWGPVSAITWFFENEPEGMVLEDDILPLPGFFRYCDELLERYRDVERVGLISGCNLISRGFTIPESYFFSRYMNIWGWAGWRRTWEHYDPHVRAWPAWRKNGGLSRVSDGNLAFESYWSKVFDTAFERRAHWWSYQLQFSLWSRGMLTAVPSSNQVENVGFGADSTHTRGRPPRHVRESTARGLDLPLRHPVRVAPVVEADRLIGRQVHGLTLAGHLRRDAGSIKVFVRHIPVLGDFLKRTQMAVWRAGQALVGSVDGSPWTRT